MADGSDESWLQKIGGTARLFPLPNVVLFPHVVQPLHIFEPRYRQMTADALADNRLIAPVLLRPGWEAEYEDRPAIAKMLCIGRVVAEQKLNDGRYNLLLRGISRARIVRELPTDKLYRSAAVELQADGPPPPDAVGQRLLKKLAGAIKPWFPTDAPALEQLDKLLHGELPLGVLADLLAFAVPLAVEAKQALLEQTDVQQRIELLLTHLQAGHAPERTERKFPPTFSSN